MPDVGADWTTVEGTRGYTHRLSVPGGWLYRDNTWRTVMCFVPEPLLPDPATVRETCAPAPSEFLKFKYSAPAGSCKCGDCQLVPHSVMRDWAARYEG